MEKKKNINIFNLNFFCKNEKSIIDIYTKKTDVIVFNNKHAFKAEKYNLIIHYFLIIIIVYFAKIKRKQNIT